VHHSALFTPSPSLSPPRDTLMPNGSELHPKGLKEMKAIDLNEVSFSAHTLGGRAALCLSSTPH